MAQEKQTLGQAIDHMIQALVPLDKSTRRTALLAVCTHLQIEIGEIAPHATSLMDGAESKETTKRPPHASAQPAAPFPPNPIMVPTAPTMPKPLTDIRSLKNEKKPATAQQMACLVAYYLQELAPDDERKQTINAADLDKYFKQAGFKLPQHLQQVLPDGKGSGYFNSSGRGEYKLNAVGYNLVVHSLPPKTPGD